MGNIYLYDPDKGSSKAMEYLRKLKDVSLWDSLDSYGQMGVDALVANSPIDTGKLEHSWGYRISYDAHGPRITWFNTDVNKGVHIALILQYGHATGTGGYVYGRDYINQAMKPVFDHILDDIGRKVII